MSARQLERWRADGLLQPNEVRSLGRGRGRTSAPSPGAHEMVVWLGRHAGPGKRPGDLALMAFGEGLPVPEAVVRKAFAEAGKLLSPENVLPGGSAEDVADAYAAKHDRSDPVPARIRRIDAALTALLEAAGVSVDEVTQAVLAQFDRQAPLVQAERVTRRDWVYASTIAAIDGAESLDVGYMGTLARSLAPLGVPAPVAEDLELCWPGSEQEAAQLLTPENGLAFLPAGSLNEIFLQLAEATSLPDLLQAWQIAAHLPVWAVDLCDRVEAALAARNSVETLNEWIQTMFGPTRGLLVTAARNAGQSPRKTAIDALILLFQREALRRVLAAVPDAEVQNLEQPWVFPTFMTDFMMTST
ncbi:hypothetical protein B0I32_13115 [Nonomuraea fuscirosea]|uniref:Uncharacterized protein n=2 Tax=Nonomuraea fuscirosea TaxID=1291556 RepID=A0A2T0M550_9ACTN|nr:hypothetical protein B0I32_13115 [Nonomuraea fuscirosea]